MKSLTERQPTHPGIFLRDVVLPPLRLSQAEIAERIGVSKNTISLLCNGKLRLGVEVAAKLGRLIGADPETLLRMQTRFDLWEVSRTDTFAKIEPVSA